MQAHPDSWRVAYALQPQGQELDAPKLARLLDGLTLTAPAILTRAAGEAEPAQREAELLEWVLQLPSSCPARLEAGSDLRR
jgi:hypothetical protein